MQEDGLYTLDGRKTSEERGRKISYYKRFGKKNVKVTVDENNNDDADDNNNNNSGYRYNQTQKAIDSLKVIKEKQVKNLKDSLEKKKEELEKRLEKIDQSNGTEAFTRDNKRFDFIVII